MNTVKSLFAAAATIHFDEILVQNLLSKNYVLLRLLFKGGYYLRAATNNDFKVCTNYQACWKGWNFVSCVFKNFKYKQVEHYEIE